MSSVWGFRLSFAAACALIVGRSAQGAPPLQGGPDAQDGATGSRSPAVLYRTYCAGCHEGQVPRAPHMIYFQTIGPKTILAALSGGAMQVQGSALSSAERRALAEFLGAAKLPPEGMPVNVKRCIDGAFDLDRVPEGDGWGMTLGNTRFVDGRIAGLKAADLRSLRVKWAFAYPGATRARAQPTVAGGSVFVGSQDGTVYALSLDTGCQRWSFQADAEVRNAISIEPWVRAQREATPRAFFGDLHGNVYAVDARTGALVWKTRADEHPNAQITAAPHFYKNRLYVPISSNEWAAAADPGYPCCSFRGGVAALDTRDGRIVWHAYSIPQVPRATGEKNSAGAPRWAPAGVPIWNSPTIDVKRNRLYVGTGEAYTSPAGATSDAVLAFDLTDGHLLWSYQSIAHDAWNMACFIGGGPNCPRENGPDLDIGASPILHTLPSGRQLLLVGEKSADVFALDPDADGKVVWKVRYGRGGIAGGVHWGMAASPRSLFVPNADTTITGKEAGIAKPGLFALEPATGAIQWFAPAPNVCAKENLPACDAGYSPPPTAIPGVVFQPSFDGWLRAYGAADGRLLWSFDTTREFRTVSGDEAHGGSIDAVGATVIDGRVLLSSGYLFGGRMPGNVLLVLSRNGR